MIAAAALASARPSCSIRLYQLLTSRLLVPGEHLQVPPELLASTRSTRIRKHGARRRAPRMAGWRLLRCNPWSHGGVDYP